MQFRRKVRNAKCTTNSFKFAVRDQCLILLLAHNEWKIKRVEMYLIVWITLNVQVSMTVSFSIWRYDCLPSHRHWRLRRRGAWRPGRPSRWCRARRPPRSTGTQSCRLRARRSLKQHITITILLRSCMLYCKVLAIKNG